MFEVFEIMNGGNAGIAGRPSKQRLENAFGTSKTMEVIEQILQHGILHRGHSIKDKCKHLQYIKIYIDLVIH